MQLNAARSMGLGLGLTRRLRGALIPDYNQRYHLEHKRSATQILRRIEEYKGMIRPGDKKLCLQYAIDTLGHKKYAPWLYVYAALSGEFKQGWIPDNFYGSVVVPRLKGNYGGLSNLKAMNSALFKSKAFPDLLCYANGVFFDCNYRVIPDDQVKHILFDKHDKVVFKLDNSLQGRGIHQINASEFSADAIRRLGNGLFQSYINQHSELAKFATGSVSTLRITTVIDHAGKASVRACYLRFGSGNDTHVKSSSHIRVSVELTSGALHDYGYDASWLQLAAHPTSQMPFSGSFVPSFSECLATAKRLHERAPYARCIGWDMTVDSEGRCRAIEWNGSHNDIKFSEATQGPCFADLGWECMATHI